MRKKIYNVLNKIYGIGMTVSFFAGVLPLFPFIVALIVGGDIGEKISVFLYKQFYPWVILAASISVLIGLVAMYIAKSEGLSLKSVSAEKTNQEDESHVKNELNLSSYTNEDLVSIITPAYNCAKYIGETIDSVLAQTYPHWEMLIVDDCSTDNTEEIVKSYNDPRIKYLKNEKNSGAALSRNYALREAKGRWIAFLDSDDMWMPEKLEHQISFMKNNGYYFSCTKRVMCEEDGTLTNRYATSPKKVTKFMMRNYCWIACFTVMYDVQKIGLIQVADLKKRNDYAMWLRVIEKCDCYYLDEVLAIHRKRPGSISNAKYSVLIKHLYLLYRKDQKLNPVHAAWRTARNVIFGVFKKLFYSHTT